VDNSKLKTRYFYYLSLLTPKHILKVSYCLLLSALFLINERAVDPHDEVISLTLKALSGNSRIPSFNDCWQCFHPRLYHTTIALISFLGGLSPIIIGQIVSAILGVMSLFLMIRNIHKLSKSISWIILPFMMFNPNLFYLSGQVANDMSAICLNLILLSIILLYYLNRTFIPLCGIAIVCVLSLLNKGTATAAVLVAILAPFITPLFFDLKYIKTAVCHSLFLVFAIVIPLIIIDNDFNPYRRYVENAIKHSNIAAIKFEAAPTPDFLNRKLSGRPGVISIVDTFFTFRIIDLIENPWITHGTEPIPFHRTSFFSQLFGRFNFIFFDQWPWTNFSDFCKYLGSLTLAFSIVPFMLMIFGLVKIYSPRFIRTTNNPEFLIVNLLMFASYMILLILFSIAYGGFDAMKATYVLPAILTPLYAFQVQLDAVNKQSKWIKAIININLIIWIVLYFINDIFLLYTIANSKNII
jgi:hypothetical protein